MLPIEKFKFASAVEPLTEGKIHLLISEAAGAEVASEATDFFHKVEEGVESLEQAMSSLLGDGRQYNSSEAVMKRSMSSSSANSSQGILAVNQPRIPGLM